MNTFSKAFLALLGLSIGSTATHAESCRVVTVNEATNIWEEGLGVYGDPEVDSDSQRVELTAVGSRIQEIRIGQMSWSRDEAVLRRSTSQGRTTWEAQPEGTDQNIRIIIYPSQRGIILLADGGSTHQRVATIDCLSIAELETSHIGFDNVTRLTNGERQALPARVRAEMAKTDIPFELGDGYYDLQWTRLYRVKNRNGVVVGYIEHAYLTYTEGEDVEVYVRYDRNGLRHGAIE